MTIVSSRDFILSALILAALPLFANAQQSASAVMNITVKVVRSSNVSAISNSLLTVDDNGQVSGKLGRVAVTRSEGSDPLVTTQETLELIDEEGNRINLPVGVLETGSEEHVNIEFNTEKSYTVPAVSNGTYSGTMTTKVEYL